MIKVILKIIIGYLKITCLKWKLKKHSYSTEGILDITINVENLNIVYTSKEFQPCSTSFDERFAFVGPSMVERKEEMEEIENINIGGPIIYIAWYSFQSGYCFL